LLCVVVHCTAPRFDRTPALAGGPRDKPRHVPMSDTFSKVEVITGVARRRRFSTELKLALVAESMQPGMSVSYVARRHGLSPSLVFRWRRLMSEGGKEAVRADDDVVAASEVRRLEERVRELERLLGRKTMEVEILKEALELTRAKKPMLLSRSPLPGDTP
jgi:transposase